MQRAGLQLCGLWSLFVMSAMLTARPAHAEELLDGAAWTLMCPSAGAATLAQLPPASGPEGNNPALRISVVRPSEPFYRIMISQRISRAVPAYSRLRLRFWARSATANPMRAVVEKNGPPYTGVLEASPTLTTAWKQYEVSGTSPAYGPNGLGVRFQVGHQAGTVDLAGITLENLGMDPTIAAARRQIRPEAVQARIRNYRMGTLGVTVRDARGKPLAHAVVHIEQIRHAFLFGCNIFNLQPAGTEEWQKAYQQRFTALFNYATLPFYWGAFEPEPGKPQYARLDAMADWCLAHGLTPKGHPLVWHEVYPRWAPNAPDEAIPLLHRRVTDTVEHYRGRIGYWDVLNEANNAAAADNGEGAWIKRDGPASVVQTALDWAREAGRKTSNILIYNDFNTGQSNVDLLTQLKQSHKLPDAIGIQSHMHGGVWPPETVWQTVDRFARFQKPIHFTEVTVLSGPRRDGVDQNHPPTDWETTAEGEAQQADYLEQFYTLLFSHPALRAITYWDLSDRGAWQNAPAGLIRKDMSPKPAYDRLMTLIHKTWWTDVHGSADKSGHFRARAFYGDYRVTAADRQGHKRTVLVSLPINSKETPVSITLP